MIHYCDLSIFILGSKVLQYENFINIFILSTRGTVSDQDVFAYLWSRLNLKLLTSH